MPTKKIATPENPSGIEVELTAEEITQREADATAWEVEKTARAEAVAQLATDKTNAKAKLIAGEALTEAEADTIVL